MVYLGAKMMVRLGMKFDDEGVIGYVLRKDDNSLDMWVCRVREMNGEMKEYPYHTNYILANRLDK